MIQIDSTIATKPLATPNYQTVRWAAEQLKVDQSTIRRWVAQGILRAVRIGPTTLRVDINSLKTSPVGLAA